jgi:predicted dehydrogenase
LKHHERVEVVAGADEGEEERLAKQAELSAPKAYADWREMLREEQPEIVTVGPRWTDSHLESVLACLEVGAHVYCEKPMTWNLADGDEIVAKTKATGKKVAVAHQGAYLPRIQHVQAMLAAGRIGEVQAIYAHGKQDRRGGGEDMVVLGTHLFNMMRLFVGDVDWMSAHITHEGRELQVGDVREADEPVGPIADKKPHHIKQMRTQHDHVLSTTTPILLAMRINRLHFANPPRRQHRLHMLYPWQIRSLMCHCDLFARRLGLRHNLIPIG